MPVSASTSPTLSEAAEVWQRQLERAGKSKRTMTTYVSSVADLDRFLADRWNSRRLRRITRGVVERYFADLRWRSSPATVSTRYKALHVFFEWAQGPGGMNSSPLDGIEAPVPPDEE